MKPVQILLLTLLFIFSGIMEGSAQQKNYEPLWKKVDELIQKKNLPKSALAEVRKIYALAKREKQPAQVIKSLVYMSRLQSENRENNQILSIRELEKELAAASEPSASIIKSMLAALYLEYLENNRWKFYGRTATVNFKKEDISTWTMEELHKKITELYLQSLSNETLLKATRLDNYEAILAKGNTRQLRPTLYDLLAHNALNYFENDERDISKPAYAFEINDATAFLPAEEFARAKFNTKDSLSLHHKALLIYQELLAFHMKDTRPDALIDADIKRIQFVHENAVLENKDALYLDALNTIVFKYPYNTVAQQASYLMAAWYNGEADKYQPLKDTARKNYRIRARSIVEAVVRDSAKKSEGWINSFNLLQQIDKPSFSFELEKVNLPNQPFRSLVSYTNISSLHFRVIKLDDALKTKLEERGEYDAFWSLLTAATPVKTWEQTLPVTRDYQNHRVEIRVDKLPAGEYYLLASANPRFDKKKSPLGAGSFFVSGISFVHQEGQFFVLNRETGQPLVSATADLYQRQYDYKTSQFKKSKLASYKTDLHGYFNTGFSKAIGDRNFYLDIRHQNDRLNLDEQVYLFHYSDYTRNSDGTEQKKIFFFTDRSIYRPGQALYFKGIVIHANREVNTVAANFSTTIYLRNANNEIIDSILLTTNEYGSITGRFQLPRNVLNGNFRISDKEQNNSKDFSVEEYKRPKFQVTFDEIKESYQVNDIIKVKGMAKAYAGNVVEGATVKYRVVREPRFIYSWYFSKWWQPPVEKMEIAHGETKTGKDGSFSIQFNAIPDKKIDTSYDPVFDYRVYADVTDISGETRSGQKRITAGYKSLVLKLAIDNRVPIDSNLKALTLLTQNLNGEFQQASIQLNVFKLSPEQRLIRSRYWEQPDQFVMNKQEYLVYFPHDEYSNETDPATWPKNLFHSQSAQSRENGSFNINMDKVPGPGYYAIEVSARDDKGREVKDLRYVEFYDPSSNSFNKPEYMWADLLKTTIEPGQSTGVQVGTSASDVFLVGQVDKQKGSWLPIGRRTQPNPFPEEKEPLQFYRLDREKKTFQLSATENDRGGYGISYFFVKDNRLHEFSSTMMVPWSNKDLQVEYSSFRDKTLPGSEEKWKLKISGYKNEKLAAELLASMYDASLDQFREHHWYKPGIWPLYYGSPRWNAETNFKSMESMERELEIQYREFDKRYDEPIWSSYYRRGYFRNGVFADALQGRAEGNQMKAIKQAAPQVEINKFTPPSESIMDSAEVDRDTKTPEKTGQPSDIQIRKNMNETAFFFPDLKTGSDGSVEFSFTAPEALTKWKFQALAHTKDLAFGLSEKEMVTQKQLMVQPNIPRFLRQGDHMELVTKIVNLTDKELTGQVQLQLVDASTNQSVDGWFINSFPNQYFTVAAGGSEVAKFPIQVPFQFNQALTWRIVASAGNFSDGEEAMLPVLTNKTLVTETVSLPVRGTATRNFRFEKLLNSGSSETLQHQSLTVEYTSNPAWYAVQALPYLMEYPYDCSEQTWNRFYANALASHMVNAAPRIKQVFNKWKDIDTAALYSNLQKNQELKSVLLEETPWVVEAKTEEQQKKNLALLFDMVRMSNELKGNLQKLKELQSENGGFVWFKGGPDDRYITQYIMTGVGHLKKLGVKENAYEQLSKAILYLDRKIREDYDQLVKSKVPLDKQPPGYMQIQYLYMRSFFPELAIPKETQTAYTYFKKQAAANWMKQNKSLQAMIALSLHRSGDHATPAAILRSLKETAINHEELGMYWKDNQYGLGWFWWQAPIETQSLLIETFSEAGKDTRTADDLRTWLIRNKQTNNWRTTKATADACYALLLQGTDWLVNEPDVRVKLGTISFSTAENKGSEAGTGYFKKTIAGEQVSPELGNISVTVKQPTDPATQQPLNRPSWGAVYWQYFEDLDRITGAATPLQLQKKLFIRTNTDRGPVLTAVGEGTELQVGDRVIVRIELRVDRDMEYVHMKDMRASALEPENVISGYRWQGGLGYYETTKDASTNFFFDNLRKGSYVFEYPLFVTHSGTFSNGITTIQCLYAPEFSAHSEGVKITVE